MLVPNVAKMTAGEEETSFIFSLHGFDEEKVSRRPVSNE
jgi:hypothetical protein